MTGRSSSEERAGPGDAEVAADASAAAAETERRRRETPLDCAPAILPFVVLEDGIEDVRAAAWTGSSALARGEEASPGRGADAFALFDVVIVVGLAAAVVVDGRRPEEAAIEVPPSILFDGRAPRKGRYSLFLLPVSGGIESTRRSGGESEFCCREFLFFSSELRYLLRESKSLRNECGHTRAKKL